MVSLMADADDELDKLTINPVCKRSGITEWPEDERPRERLLSRGAAALTDAEVLAILLRVGVKGKSAVELGRELLGRFGSVQAMMIAPLSAWDGIKGLGNAKLAQLQAALELGRRAALPTTRAETVIKSTRQAADYFTVRLRSLPNEHFRVAYLTAKGDYCKMHCSPKEQLTLCVRRFARLSRGRCKSMLPRWSPRIIILQARGSQVKRIRF